MTGCEDILDLLLPDAAHDDRERARRLTLALRLFLHAGRAERAEEGSAALDGASAELVELARRRREQALCALLFHHLAAHLGPGRFRAWGRPELSVDEAWRVLVDEPTGGSLRLPAPGESPLAVATRLYAHLAGLEGGEHAAALWGARLRRARAGPVDGEEAHRELLTPHASPASRATRRAAVGGVAACLLERGRVREARLWLDDQLGELAGDDELAWLLVWCELLLGNEEAARTAARGLAAYEGDLPAPLAELRGRREDWIALLPGREPEPEPEGSPERPERADLGASALAVFVLGPASEAVRLEVEVAPGLRDRVDEWVDARDGASADPAAPEHTLIARAAPVLRHRREAPLRGALDPACLSQALVPIRFDHGAAEGEVAGWVSIELGHHLLPSAGRLAALAAGWRGRVLEAAWERRGAVAEAPATVSEPATGRVDGRDPRARAFAGLVAGLGMKLAMRRWWGYDVEDDSPQLVASSGGALADWRDDAGRGRALVRALTTGGRIRFDAPDERLSLHARSGSGLVLAARGPRGTEALLAFESTRRRDFALVDQERLARAMDEFLEPWCGARFSAWHAERFGEEVLVEPRLGFPLAPGDLLAAGRARMPAAVVGPEGAGKETLARWLHREGAGTAGRPRRLLAGEGSAARLVPRGEATWIVAGLERAGEAWQAELEATLARLGDEAPRVLVLLGQRPEVAARAGGLHGELAARVGRLVLTVPPLCDRRNAIPSLARLFVRRVAEAEGLAAPQLDEAAVALLWRQSWPGNLRQLEAVMARLVLQGPGAAVGAAEVREVAERVGLHLVAKIPSRHPSRRDLFAALEETRCASGTANKTRAAAYLGWDPDTLVARLRDARIDPADPFAASAGAP
ncbi:MAG: hypothetical protein AAF682_08635 [Planctomycetota bacterium]